MSSVNPKAFTEGSLGLTDTLEISDVQKWLSHKTECCV